MSERNYLTNGRFLHDLDGWTATSATYAAGDGDEHYGVANLAIGGSVAQDFAVPYARGYRLHLAVKSAAALGGSQVVAVIADGSGNTVLTQPLEGDAATWTINTVALGLAPGSTYTLTIRNASAANVVYIDDVWLWFVPISRAALADIVADRLGALATDQSLNSGADGDLTEGDYTYAIDAGLRAIGAVNPETGEPDERYVEPNQLGALIEATEREMLNKLTRDYALQTDLQVGPRRESRSQISQALSSITGKRGAQVGMARLIRQSDDYEMQ